jgi:outer membrane protein TolC
MKKKKYVIGFLFLLLFSASVSAQVTLEQCYDSARANYPVIRQFDLLERTEQFTLENIKRSFLPQLNLSARASWQSDVTKLPFEMPGMNIEWMEQDQYQLVLELKQLVYDGGMVRARREWQKARTAADRQQAEVELYALHQRIDQVYFGILLQNAQHKQMQLLLEQLQKSLEQVQAFLKRGVVCPADVDAVQVELRTVEQSVRSLETSRKAYCEVLSLLTGMDSLRAEALVTPAVTESGNEILRPELQLFARQKNMLLAQKETTRAGIRPTLGLFMQGGYGDPGLNMLKGGFSPYYIAGVQLSWNIGKLYTLKNERRLIDEQMSQVDIRQSTFLLNTRAEAIQARRNIERIRDEIQADEDIIRMRGQILESVQARVANGTLSVLEMLRMVLEKEQACQNKAIHEVELLQARYALKRIQNN